MAVLRQVYVRQSSTPILGSNLLKRTFLADHQHQHYVCISTDFLNILPEVSLTSLF